MPFKSEKQRRYLHIHEPELAHEWEHRYGSTPKKKKKKARGHDWKAEKKKLTGE